MSINDMLMALSQIWTNCVINYPEADHEEILKHKEEYIIKRWELKQLQSLPLEIKIEKTKIRIREWYEHWGGDVYISFSGGKDSTVLLDIVRQVYPNLPAVFIDTGLEYPEIRDFVKTINNVITVRPKMTFKEVLDKYGYPVVSKEQAEYIQEYRTTKSEKLKDIR